MTGAGQGEEFQETTHNGKPALGRARDECGTEGGAEKLDEINRLCIWRPAAVTEWNLRPEANQNIHVSATESLV